MNEKLSDHTAKFVDQTFENIHELDIHEQNKAVKELCLKILEQRKSQLDRMHKEIEAYALKIDEFIHILSEFMA